MFSKPSFAPCFTITPLFPTHIHVLHTDQQTAWLYHAADCQPYGTGAFSVDGPVCRNELPDNLKSSDLRLIVLNTS